MHNSSHKILQLIKQLDLCLFILLGKPKFLNRPLFIFLWPLLLPHIELISLLNLYTSNKNINKNSSFNYLLLILKSYIH